MGKAKAYHNCLLPCEIAPKERILSFLGKHFAQWPSYSMKGQSLAQVTFTFCLQAQVSFLITMASKHFAQWPSYSLNVIDVDEGLC